MVPVYVITGFLGAGKTSLLNQFLALREAATDDATRQGRVALVVNELGAVGIDGGLLPEALSRHIELPGGCICCTLNEAFDTTLLELIERNPGLAGIAIETTGVAEPLPIVWSCERAPLASAVRFAAVITLVDAENVLESLAVSPAVDAQIAAADVLLITKHELVSSAHLAAVRAKLAELAPGVLVVAPPRAELGMWLETFLSTKEDASLDVTPPRASEAVARHGEDQPHGAPHHHHPHAGTVSAHALEARSFSLPALIDLEALCEGLEALGPEYVRIKGIAWCEDPRAGHRRAHWAAFHRVGRRVSSEPWLRGGADDTDAAPASARRQMVAIGQRVDEREIAACLAQSTLAHATVRS